MLTDGHIKGIVSIDWSLSDPSLILSCGNDEKLVLWNYKTQQVIKEFSIGENPKCAQWSPKLPSIISILYIDQELNL